jgi:hypothetical protein
MLCMNTQEQCKRVSALIDFMHNLTCFTEKFQILYLHACIHEKQLHACIDALHLHTKNGNISYNLHDDAWPIES